MRVTKIPDSGPKKSLLDATERLVVEKGFDLVSVRDITGVIKANVAAVNYHFGSREGLMDLVMSHVMEAVDAERVEALGNAARLESRGPVEGIVSAYVNSVLVAAGRVGMDLGFFLKLAGRVMVFPSALMSPALAEARKQVSGLYLEALAKALPQADGSELEAEWAFFEAGLGQSLVNLRSNSEPAVQVEQWIRFGVNALGGGGISKKTAPVVHSDQPVSTGPSVTNEAPEVPEIPKPAKAPKSKSKKADDQSMMFDF